MIGAKLWIRQVLFEANLNISGNIYIDRKPFTGKEDIVVNSVTSNDEFFQANILNVNCHVPDLKITSGGVEYDMPNTARLNEIAEQVKPVLRSAMKDQKYIAHIEFMRQEKEQEEHSHFINFQIRINAVNY